MGDWVLAAPPAPLSPNVRCTETCTLCLCAMFHSASMLSAAAMAQQHAHSPCDGEEVRGPAGPYIPYPGKAGTWFLVGEITPAFRQSQLGVTVVPCSPTAAIVWTWGSSAVALWCP